MTELTHLDDDGRARMVDVGHKAVTARTAVAHGRLETTAEVVALVRAEGLPKADVLATARLAGISAAKHTWELVPLCHQIPLSGVNVSFELEETSVRIEATARTKAPTGVEMEALTAVAVAGLTLHDMVKAIDPAAVLGEIRLVEKTGGKHGRWTRPGVAGDEEPGPGAAEEAESTRVTGDPRRAVVVVASTSGARGEREDTTGPVIVGWLAERGFDVEGPVVVADAEVAEVLAAHVAGEPHVVVTTGGTGISGTDRTPEATRAVLTEELPGVAEEIRRRGTAATPTAVLSRALVGLAGRTLVANLPGSPGGVRDGLSVLDEVLEHVLDQVRGGGRHDG
ncbi:bifunctional molybdenum cofactor biosynthesis protein MoaC/MoaB [Sanguibacter suaedae]|uniref:Cyclic pyranopterin monophosphate synthase n=1 Tax=Sanguibacter suaedae TaxID=2795737 RepID=A0A934I445_9MICO|nr:bifunctional molybdenum cofactor biosynthesis protein MoaC/MoaB [Sanguibacter suaedae]MBI9115234.1 bifunctional molybdenum cofactor biosynthesis protein MoaC/MoaB [Sanguibacter suaedae]